MWRLDSGWLFGSYASNSKLSLSGSFWSCRFHFRLTFFWPDLRRSVKRKHQHWSHWMYELNCCRSVRRWFVDKQSHQSFDLVKVRCLFLSDWTLWPFQFELCLMSDSTYQTSWTCCNYFVSGQWCKLDEALSLFSFLQQHDAFVLRLQCLERSTCRVRTSDTRHSSSQFYDGLTNGWETLSSYWPLNSTWHSKFV